MRDQQQGAAEGGVRAGLRRSGATATATATATAAAAAGRIHLSGGVLHPLHWG